MKKKIIVIGFILGIVLVAGCIQKKTKEDSDMSWPKLPSYGKCNSDADCVLISCQNYGNTVAHKNALDHLDEIKEKMCEDKVDPTVSYDGVVCWVNTGECRFKEPEIQRNGNYTDNLTKPGLPPDARQPFSDD